MTPAEARALRDEIKAAGLFCTIPRGERLPRIVTGRGPVRFAGRAEWLAWWEAREARRREKERAAEEDERRLLGAGPYPGKAMAMSDKSPPARWYDDAHPPAEPGLYYYERCDQWGNPLPGLYHWIEGQPPHYPEPPFKAFGPIRGALRPWPMTDDPSVVEAPKGEAAGE